MTTTTLGNIAALTGLIGTIGGLAISYISLKHSFDQSKHKIKVFFGKNLLFNVPGVDDTKEHLTVKVANLGTTNYTVSSISISVGRHSGGMFVPVPKGTHSLPVTLKRDETCNFWVNYDDEALKSIKKLTKRKMVKLRANITDYAETKFHSKWMKIYIKETNFYKFKKKLNKIWHSIIKMMMP